MGFHFEEIYTNMLPVLESKKYEFDLYGYTTVTREDIWIYCIQKVWRNKNVEEIPIHKMVNDILHISPAAFMTYTQIETHREADWFSELNKEKLQLLLDPPKDDEQFT